MTKLRDTILPLSRQRDSVKRNDLINHSLGWSRIQSERLLRWSSSNDRGRLVAMRFHQNWRHDQCPMTSWYNQQRASSTRFRSIEHRKNIQGPFFHEFLILKLVDGAVCRVERIGDGSRADAIRSIGCTSYDLIQWFSQENHSAATNSSEVVAEVDFGRDFDILDVLAVCYSIQRIKACRVYTLQRYNCYFLCLTILTVLARRVASWETTINENNWNSCVTSALDGLSDLSPEESNKHLILRICRLLEPDNPQSATFIIDGLRAHLASGSNTWAQYRDGLCGMLWQTSRDTRLHDIIFIVLRSSSIDSLFAGETPCATQLRHAIQTSETNAKIAIASNKLLAKPYVKALADNESRLLNKITKAYRDDVRMRELENPLPFGKRVAAQLLGLALATSIPLLPVFVSFKRSPSGDFERMMTSRVSLTLSTMRHARCLGRMAIDLLALSDLEGEQARDAERLVRQPAVVPGITSILDALEAKGVLRPPETSLAASHLVGQMWQAAEILCSFVAPTLGHDLQAVLESQTKYIRVHSEPTDESRQGEGTTVAEFQESYIRQRIQAHAKRVDTHQLAAAPLVCRDIENTMEKVWRSLPSGFGSGRGTPS
ncbi:hypothetical protein FS749_005410 [Ceratobasidium sp. UAMH 11750]|nr:hypothetical protein FS749_005410 [Ceratobasidium sp. UAMH 11750]